MSFKVTSDTNPDVEYKVDPDQGTCTCPHYTNRLEPANKQDGGDRVCKHVARIREETKGN